MMVSQTLAILSGIFALALASVQSAETCSGEFCSAAPSAGSSLLQATVARHWKGEDMHNELVHESEATVQDKRAKQSQTHTAPGSLERKLKNLAELVAQTSGNGTLIAEAQDIETDLADEGLTEVEDDTEAEAEIVDLMDQESTEVDPVEAAEDGIEFTNDDLTALHHGVNMEARNNNTFQGDMMPGSEEQLSLFQKIEGKHGSYAWAGTPWPGGVVKYCLSSDFPASGIKAWELSLKQYKKALACLTWLDVGYESGSSTDGNGRCQESGAIFVQSKNDGCWSYVGKTSHANQQLNIQSPGCDSVGTTMHEIAHALGMAHEQARPDRDEYVHVDFDNTDEDAQFTIDENGDTVRPYDILSLMHYGVGDFATDGSRPVITVKPKGYEKYTSNPAEYAKYQIGNRIGLSQTDVLQLADMYNNVVEGGCTPKNLNTQTTCTDKLKNGAAWADSYGDCDKYRARSEADCSRYTSGIYCCGCGGGWAVQSYEDSEVITCGGNAGGAACMFPFTHKDVSYTACTSLDNSEPWCYTDSGKWGNCECPTTTPVPVATPVPTDSEVITCGGDAGGAACMFPFTYKDVSYTACTSLGNSEPWCYTDSGKWGNCNCD